MFIIQLEYIFRLQFHEPNSDMWKTFKLFKTYKKYLQSPTLSKHFLKKSFATSRTGHDNILKWNSSEDTAGNCYALELI